MKTNSIHPSPFRAATLFAAALLISGCLQERLAWSPDGKHAAIVTADGLHLSDASGNLSPLLAPGVYRAAWLPDSQRLVLARKKAISTFAEVAAALGPDRARSLAAKAESAWKRLKDLPGSEEFGKRAVEELGDDISGVLAYLREQPHHLASLREKLGADWKKEDETKPVDLNEVVIARLNGGTLAFGPTLFIGLPGISSLRPAPGGQAVAFAMPVELSPHPDSGICVLVVPTDASAPAKIAATQGTTDPDWTRDGRSLVFFKASASPSQGDDLRLGALVQREVLDFAGRINFAPDSTDLAGLIFHQRNRVRCLRDGRVLFNASPLTLPTTGGNEKDREQLFVLDRAKGSAITPLIPPAQLEPLPKALSAFEISPDESQVLFGSENGEVWLLTLATGAVQLIADKIESDKSKHEGENYPAPVWRSAGDITFLRRNVALAGAPGASRFELVLRRGKDETILSRNWEPSILRRLID